MAAASAADFSSTGAEQKRTAEAVNSLLPPGYGLAKNVSGALLQVALADACYRDIETLQEWRKAWRKNSPSAV